SKCAVHSQEHQVGSAPNSVKAKENEESGVVSSDPVENSWTKQCFECSSVYNATAHEHYDSLFRRDGIKNEIKIAVKQLEEAMDPFHPECATRGNWWE
ncbi:hypothetical protein KI387_020952, partial [Taxus chinensis]